VDEKDIRLERPSVPFSKGLIQVFTGDGKGKTTAALGTIMRASGHGLRVYIIFFMKGDYAYGERKILSQLPNVTVAWYGDDNFVFPGKLKKEQIEKAEQAFESARLALTSGKYDLVIMDEINVAVAFQLISIEKVLALIKQKPPDVELILTGRKADSRLIQAADLVTEMVKVKHPYDIGIGSRMGIEY